MPNPAPAPSPPFPSPLSSAAVLRSWIDNFQGTTHPPGFPVAPAVCHWRRDHFSCLAPAFSRRRSGGCSRAVGFLRAAAGKSLFVRGFYFVGAKMRSKLVCGGAGGARGAWMGGMDPASGIVRILASTSWIWALKPRWNFAASRGSAVFTISCPCGHFEIPTQTTLQFCDLTPALSCPKKPSSVFPSASHKPRPNPGSGAPPFAQGGGA